MKHRQLADLINIQSGYAFKSKEYTDNGHFLVRIGNVQDGYVSLDNPKYVALDGRTERFALREGDFLTSLTGNIGRVARVQQEHLPAALNQRVARLTVADPTALQPDYFFYFLSSDLFREELCEGGHGAAQQNVSPSAISKLTLPVPPLAEQQRIVGILDEAFEGIATAKANAEKNLQNARALFESHLQSVFTQRGEGWVERPLEDVASILNGYSFKSGDFSAKRGVKCIKITNVGVREFVCESDGDLPESFAAEYGKVSVKKGSIVLALTRTIISGGLKVAVVPDEYDGALVNQRVAAIVSNPDAVNSAFLFAYLSTQMVVDYVKDRVNTLMQPNLSIVDLRSMPIPIPPSNVQTKIIHQVDSLREETQRLATIYERKLAALDDLKKSLLHRAFSGEL